MTQSPLTENQPVLIRKKAPVLLGFVSIPFYMMAMYLLALITSVLHCMIVLQTTVRLKGGYVVSVFFGLLGPISVIHWIISLLFAVIGAMTMFSRSRDYMHCAVQFRRWVRISRYFILSLIVTTIQFFYGCSMLVRGLSLHNTVVREMDANGVARNDRQRYVAEATAKQYDVIFYSNANLSLAYPLNLLYNMANQWGYTVTLAMIFPWTFFIFGHNAQIRYFNWRFRSAGINID